MRVLSRREMGAMETAWTFLERVGGMYGADKDGKERTVDGVRVGGNRLPASVVRLTDRLGGLRALNAKFNGMTKTTAFDDFVRWMLKGRRQPRDYWAEGSLTYEHESKDYVEIVYEEETA